MREQMPVRVEGEVFALVEMRDGLLNHPVDLAKSDNLLTAALRNDHSDPFGGQLLSKGD